MIISIPLTRLFCFCKIKIQPWRTAFAMEVICRKLHDLIRLKTSIGPLELWEFMTKQGTWRLCISKDIADLIKETFDPHFGFSRYAERLGRSASNFNELEHALEAPETLVSSILIELLEEKIVKWNPEVVCFTVPFPGNLYGALKCGQFLKKAYPDDKIDHGWWLCQHRIKKPCETKGFLHIQITFVWMTVKLLYSILLEHLSGYRDIDQLKRVFSLSNGVVSLS